MDVLNMNLQQKLTIAVSKAAKILPKDIGDHLLFIMTHQAFAALGTSLGIGRRKREVNVVLNQYMQLSQTVKPILTDTSFPEWTLNSDQLSISSKPREALLGS